MKNGISKQPSFFACRSNRAAALFAFYYNQAFPEASIDLETEPRRGCGNKPVLPVLKNGFDLTGYRAVAVFKERRNEIDFLERHLGLKAANDLFRKTVAVWRWKVRWFRSWRRCGMRRRVYHWRAFGRLLATTAEVRPRVAPRRGAGTPHCGDIS